MKTTLLLLLGLLIISCSNDEDSMRLFYEYQPDQEYMINVEVIPTEDIILDYQEMLEEVNADYFNRYGIGVNFILRDRQELSHSVKYENEILLPQHLSKEPKKHITLYIIPKEYMYWENTLGYAVLESKSVIIREETQTNDTLAHEIAHVLGLDHNETDYNNVMQSVNVSRQFGVPTDFTQAQVDMMKKYIENNLN